MLDIVVPKIDLWNEYLEEFLTIPPTKLQLEHSLYAISKWEEQYKKPFLDRKEKTQEEINDYVRCMCLNYDSIKDKRVFDYLPASTQNAIGNYINDPHTATTITHRDKRPSREIITAEVIYYWMTALQIPFECQYWNFNKLMTLIEVCNIKNTPPKKMGKRATMMQNEALNAQRRAAMHTKG